jgi:hypothetical protein
MEFFEQMKQEREEKKRKTRIRFLAFLVIFVVLVVVVLVVLPGLDYYVSPIGWPETSWLNSQNSVGLLKSSVVKTQKIQMSMWDIYTRSDNRGIIVKNRNTEENRFGFSIMLANNSNTPYLKWEDSGYAIADTTEFRKDWTDQQVTNGTEATSSRPHSTVTCDNLVCDQLVVGDDICIKKGTSATDLSFVHSNGKNYNFFYQTYCISPGSSSGFVMPQPTLEYETIRVKSSFTVGNFQFLQDPVFVTRLRIQYTQTSTFPDRAVNITIDSALSPGGYFYFFLNSGSVLGFKAADSTSRAIIGTVCGLS